ncbi:MAG TPA: NAD(P)-binding protein, partial [Thermoanaerobaculia bacterium]
MAIIGSGIIGPIAAHALRRSGYDVTLCSDRWRSSGCTAPWCSAMECGGKAAAFIFGSDVPCWCVSECCSRIQK